MSTGILILGESGTGKSSSIRSLNPEETFIINVLDKPLPFKGFRDKYVAFNQDNPAGNYCATDDYNKIIITCRYIAHKMPQIKNVIIDDFQYILANEFMTRAREKGYEKFTEIGQHAWSIFREITHFKDRPDLLFFVLSHSDVNDQGKHTFKSIGKLLSEKITVEGMFTIVLHALIYEKQFQFLTQNDGVHVAKSPMGMFATDFIPNSLELVREAIIKY